MSALVLFDDAVADGWAPFALTRPIGELRFGRWTLRERVAAAAGRPVGGHLTRPWLSRYHEPGAPPVLDRAPVGPVVLWCSRAVPAVGAAWPAEAANLWVDGTLAGVCLQGDAEPPDRDWLARPSPIPGLADTHLAGDWLEHPWDLVARGVDRLSADLAFSASGAGFELPEGCWKLGDHPIELAGGVRVEPGVVFDTRHGAIVLEDGVSVGAGARLGGPVYAGPRSRLLGGVIEGLSAGPYTHIRGEVEEVTVLGYTNKAHDGFLGHAYLGRWVNLGALTTNSDLKNNYGTIRMGPPGAALDTGLTKIGCLLGDHVKTGIGALLNTGTVVGAGSNLFGAELPPKWVEPFSWGQGADLQPYRRDAFLETAAKVVARRGVEADEALLGWLGDVWDAARGTT